MIDAVEPLHSGHIDISCVVSSDSDFTPLAVRIREKGRDVYGFGKRDTPTRFRNACKNFIVISDVAGSETLGTAPAKETGGNAFGLTEIIKTALRPDPTGWTALSVVGTNLAANGHQKLARAHGGVKALVEATRKFELESKGGHHRIKLK